MNLKCSEISHLTIASFQALIGDEKSEGGVGMQQPFGGQLVWVGLSLLQEHSDHLITFTWF